MGFTNTPNFATTRILYCDRYRFLMDQETPSHFYTIRLFKTELMSIHFPNPYDSRWVLLGGKPRDTTSPNGLYLLVYRASSLLRRVRRLPTRAIQIWITHPPSIEMGMGAIGEFYYI